MDIIEIRKMLALMEKFAGEKKLNIISDKEVSREEAAHITASHRAMNRHKIRSGLISFTYTDK
jgi:hypothetical protein